MEGKTSRNPVPVAKLRYTPLATAILQKRIIIGNSGHGLTQKSYHKYAANIDYVGSNFNFTGDTGRGIE